MNEILNEQISALVDDELVAAEQTLLIRRLADDAALRQRLSRYQLISDALRDDLPRHIDPGFQARVHGALQQEPAVHAARSGLAGLFKPVAGLAVAASIAVVAVLSLQSLRQESDEGAPLVATAPASGDYIRNTGESAPLQAQTPAQNLDIYLVNHNEFTVSRGMLPYMRLVGHGMNVEKD
ncbi:MAG: sigma-E factor negative regulatory protein [Gammaproteobacteria bacterium]|jgi:sigma-E factor negative regulatory protein RseA